MRHEAAFLAGVTMLACSSPSKWSPSAVEVVGDPLGAWRTDPSEAYARNIWDLQEYGGRLYLGYGDTIENTGPTDVIAFDPADGTFIRETVVQEEAIFSYRVFGDRMFMPGVDAVASPDDMLYVRNTDGWTQRPLADVVHTNDVAVRGDEICVAVQDTWNGGSVRCSTDDGGAWTSYPVRSWRSVSLFELGGVLYVSSHDSGVTRVDGRPTSFALPGGADPDVLVSRPTRCGNDVVFIARSVHYETEQASPSKPRLTLTGVTVKVQGLFRASVDAAGSIDVARIDVAGTPVDVFADGGLCHALTNEPNGAAGSKVAIYQSRDNRTWTVKTTFVADAMARSAALMQGNFYVGLGCELGQCTSAAGRVLRISAR